MIQNYLKIAWRNILKYKISSIINILGLTLGIASCLLILIFVDYELSFDKHHSNSDRIYRVVQEQEFPEETYYFNTTPYPLAKTIAAEVPLLENVTQIAGLTTHTFGIKNLNTTNSLFEESKTLYADSNFFQVFDGFNWLAGNKEAALKDANSIIITEQIADSYFGIKDSNYNVVINRIILLDSEIPLTVTGVVENPSGNSSYKFNIVLPYSLFEKQNLKMARNWSGTHLGTTFVVLGEAAMSSNAIKTINRVSTNYLSDIHSKRVSYKLQSLANIHTNPLYGHEPGGYVIPKKLLIISAAIALFILLIAIANFINLVTAQSVLRSKEVGLLKIMGSSRWRLVLRFIIENSLLVVISIALSVLIIVLLIDKINNFLTIIDLKLGLSENFIYLIAIIGVLTITIATLYPAFILSAINPIKALRGKNDKISEGVGLRKSLITFQFTIVQIFVIAVIVVGLQMQYFESKDVGFNSDSIIITSAPQFDNKKVFKNKLSSIAEVTEVSFGSGPPMGIDGLSLGTSYRLPSENSENGNYAEMKVGDENYLKLYDLHLLAGKSFETTTNKIEQFVVNETLINFYGWSPQEAVGKQLTINEGNGTIVGVVSDYHNNALQYEITPSIIVNWNFLQNSAFIKTTATNPELLSEIETAWNDSFQDSVFDYSFLSEAIEREYVIENLIYQGFKVLSLLAICIGSLGLLGLMTFVLLSKSKEIAIRNVLGSRISQIVVLLSKEYALSIVISFLIAAPITFYFLKNWLMNFTYQIDLSIWMFISGGTLTFIIAFLACSFQSIKMAMVKPIKFLRAE